MRCILVLIIVLQKMIFFAQSEHEYITELIVVDTNIYNGDSILVFNDGSWEYADQFNIKEVIISSYDQGYLSILPEELYSKNWKNHKTFSQEYNLSNVKDTITILTKGFVSPVNYSCNSSFKMRGGRWHQGQDFASPTGTPIKAAWNGRVRYAQMNSGGFGNLVIIRHENGLETYYAHMSKIEVSINDDVTAGQVIGKVGNTGHSTGPHLHFEVRFLDNPLDPQTVKDKETLQLSRSCFYTMKKTNTEVWFKNIFNISMIESKKVVVEKTITKGRRRTSSNL